MIPKKCDSVPMIFVFRGFRGMP